MFIQDPLMGYVVNLVGEECGIDNEDVKQDGKPIFKDETILIIEGSLRVILAAERVLLNFLQHLSGIATETSRYVAAVRGTDAMITATRKTVPGLRVVEKIAVQHGGGLSHRMGLYDGILIKDNHIAAAGGIAAAVTAAKRRAPHTLRIQVECETLEQVDDALGAGADMLLLDNMSPESLRDAVSRGRGRVILEASGGITLHNVRDVAETGVDRISVGVITNAAGILPMSLDVEG
jgi:nicotinate-nucleotide pyrophosphorylase (carboxylating)